MKFFSNILLLTLTLLTATQQIYAAPPPVKPVEEETEVDSKNLKILSWNIYMLPKIVVQRHKRERAHAIVDTLRKSDFDIIVFQEAFFPASREIIGEGLRTLYPYQYGPANNDGKTLKTNSGVWILSKINLKLLNATQFKNCTGTDCFARKGAMLLEGVWNDKPFQILGTHLQADGFDIIRQKQMDQIYIELLAENKREGVPQIICGDMNTEREMTEHYCEMLNCLDAQDGDITGVEKCSYDGVNNPIAQSFGVNNKANYDYILVRSNGMKMKALKRFVSVMRKGKKYLSDHYGVACELKF